MLFVGSREGVGFEVTRSNIDKELLRYLLDNFAISLGVDELNEKTLHHFRDGLLAHRTYFLSIGYQDLVKKMDLYLDHLESLMQKLDGKPMRNNPLLQNTSMDD